MNVALMLSIVLAADPSDLLFLTVARVSSDTVVDTVPKDSVPAPSVTRACPFVPSEVGRLNAVPPDVMISLLPSDSIFSFASVNCKPMLTGIITSAPAVKLMFPVPAGAIVMSAFEPLEVKSFAVMLVAVTAPAKVPAPSTSSVVLFNNFNSSLFNLAAITFDPAFLTLNSIAPSSVPSEASSIFPQIDPY